jgi:hypothetical protein
MIKLDSKISIPADVLFHELAGEAVVLNLVNGNYYGLDEVGTRMWQLATEYASMAPALEVMLEEYDVDETRLHQDMFRLFEDLVAHGLLTIEQEGK